MKTRPFQELLERTGFFGIKKEAPEIRSFLFQFVVTKIFLMASCSPEGLRQALSLF